MAIYGTALLAFCLLCGLIVGKFIGMFVGVNENVGGVGIAMLLLVVITGRCEAGASSGCLPTRSPERFASWMSYLATR